MDDYWWEPPFAGTELEHLLGALDRQRTTFRWKADDLDAAGLSARVGASTLTLGGLLKHLAGVEDSKFTMALTGESIGEPWISSTLARRQRLAVRHRGRRHPEQLYAFYDGAVERSRARLAAVLETGGLDQPTQLEGPDGAHASLRRLLFDLLEEYGRHTGHADLLREAVDGRVGEDPPAGWRAVSGRFGPTG